MSGLFLIWLTAVPAGAETPLPSYRQAMVDARYREVDALLSEGCRVNAFPVLCAPGAIEAVVAAVDAFQRTVTQDAGLEYLAGLALRYGGREKEAVRRYEAAIALDAGLVTAWYDLGEIQMTRGNYAEARKSFEQVRALHTGDKPWVGAWRLAEVCALEHDAAGFEANIKDALRDGFSFRIITGTPNWRTFYADPALRDTLDKLLTVYADEEVRRSLAP